MKKAEMAFFHPILCEMHPFLHRSNLFALEHPDQFLHSLLSLMDFFKTVDDW